MDTHDELFIIPGISFDKDSGVWDVRDDSPPYNRGETFDENSIVYAYKCSIVGCNFISHQPHVTKRHEMKHSERCVVEYPLRSDTFMCPYKGCYYVSSIKRYWKAHMRDHKVDGTVDCVVHNTIDEKNVLYLYVCPNKKCRDFASQSIDVMVFHRDIHLFIAGISQQPIVVATPTTPSEDYSMNAYYDTIY